MAFNQKELEAELEKAQAQDEFTAGLKDDSPAVVASDGTVAKSTCNRGAFTRDSSDIRFNQDSVRGWKEIANRELAVLSKNLRTARTWEEVKQEAMPFIGKNIENLETGFKAYISKHTFVKMLHKNAIFYSVSDEAHYAVVGNIDKLFRLATVGPRRPGTKAKGVPDIAATHHFDVPMPFKGEVLHVKLLIKESKPPEFDLYHVYTFQSVEVARLNSV